MGKIVVWRKPRVYRSALTGHWIVDESGRPNPGARGGHSQGRQGWRRWPDAVADALTKVRVMELPDEVEDEND